MIRNTNNSKIIAFSLSNDFLFLAALLFLFSPTNCPSCQNVRKSIHRACRQTYALFTCQLDHDRSSRATNSAKLKAVRFASRSTRFASTRTNCKTRLWTCRHPPFLAVWPFARIIKCFCTNSKCATFDKRIRSIAIFDRIIPPLKVIFFVLTNLPLLNINT